MKYFIIITALISFTTSISASQVTLDSDCISEAKKSSLENLESEINNLGNLITQESDVYSRDVVINAYQDAIKEYKVLKNINDIALWQLLCNK